MWGAAAVEEWPLNTSGFTAAMAFLCDGSDSMLETLIAGTPATDDVMSSLLSFAGIELKDNPTVLSCLVESGFYRGPVLKPRPSFVKVRAQIRFHFVSFFFHVHF